MKFPITYDLRYESIKTNISRNSHETSTNPSFKETTLLQERSLIFEEKIYSYNKIEIFSVRTLAGIDSIRSISIWYRRRKVYSQVKSTRDRQSIQYLLNVARCRSWGWSRFWAQSAGWSRRQSQKNCFDTRVLATSAKVPHIWGRKYVLRLT